MPKLKELLSKETLEQVLEEVPDDVFEKNTEDVDFIPDDGSYVPRKRLNDKTEEIEVLQDQIDDRENQIGQLKEDTQATDELKNKIEELQEKNEKQRETLEQELEEQRKGSQVEVALAEENARSHKAVKALLDMDNIKVDGDQVLGLDDQLKAIKEENDYLFETKDGETAETSGGQMEGGTSTPSENPFAEETLNLQRQGEVLDENPSRAKSLIQEAGEDPSDYGLSES